MKTRLWLMIVCAIALIAAACGGGDDDGETETRGDGAESTSADGGTDAAAILFESDFSSACNGVGVEGARGYASGDAVTHMVGFTGEGSDYSVRSTMLNEAWRAPFDELTDVQMVVCLSRTAEVEGQLCSGYEDDGLEWEVQTFGASYDVSVRDAATGDELETISVSADADDCPIFSTYREGDPSPVADYATPDGDLELLLAPYAAGGEASATDDSGDEATDGADDATDDPEPTDESGTDDATDAVGRDEAVAQLIDFGGYSDEEAACVVDGTIAEYGEFVLEPDEEQQVVLGQLLLDCAAEFGTATDDGIDDDATSDVDSGDGPDTPAPGTDAALDVLWNACAAGDGEACDTLYWDSPVGSAYEQFGFTCGNRTDEIVVCADFVTG